MTSPTPAHPSPLVARARTHSRARVLLLRPSNPNRQANDIMSWIASGDLKVSVDATFPLDDAPEAHKYLEAGKSKGKVLYKI